MCLNLYLASPRALAGAPPSPLQIRLASPDAGTQLRPVITLPHLSLVTVDGCGCAFPSVTAPVEYFDGLLGDDASRAIGAAHLRALFELVDRTIGPGEHVELFPVWIGEEPAGARARIETTTAAIDTEHFAFVESHLYVVRA